MLLKEMGPQAQDKTWHAPMPDQLAKVFAHLTDETVTRLAEKALRVRILLKEIGPLYEAARSAGVFRHGPEYQDLQVAFRREFGLCWLDQFYTTTLSPTLLHMSISGAIRDLITDGSIKLPHLVHKPEGHNWVGTIGGVNSGDRMAMIRACSIQGTLLPVNGAKLVHPYNDTHHYALANQIRVICFLFILERVRRKNKKFA